MARSGRWRPGSTRTSGRCWKPATGRGRPPAGAVAKSAGDCSHGASGCLAGSRAGCAGSISGSDPGLLGGVAGCQGGFPGWPRPAVGPAGRPPEGPRCLGRVACPGGGQGRRARPDDDAGGDRRGTRGPAGPWAWRRGRRRGRACPPSRRRRAAARARRRSLVSVIATTRHAISTPAATARPTTSERSRWPGSDWLPAPPGERSRGWQAGRRARWLRRGGRVRVPGARRR